MFHMTGLTIQSWLDPEVVFCSTAPGAEGCSWSLQKLILNYLVLRQESTLLIDFGTLSQAPLRTNKILSLGGMLGQPRSPPRWQLGLQLRRRAGGRTGTCCGVTGVLCGCTFGFQLASMGTTTVNLPAARGCANIRARCIASLRPTSRPPCAPAHSSTPPWAYSRERKRCPFMGLSYAFYRLIFSVLVVLVMV